MGCPDAEGRSSHAGSCADRMLARGLGAVVLAGLASCGGGSSTEMPAAPQPQQAVLQGAGPVAACSYEHVYLTVERVRVKRPGGGDRWIELSPAMPRQVDLALPGTGLLQQLGLAPLAPGAYDQLRLIVAPSGAGGSPAALVQLAGGTTLPLQVPAGMQSGLKLDGNLVVPEGRTGDVTVDAAQLCGALMQVGNPSAPRYQLRPDINATLQLASPVPAAPESRIPLPGGAMFVPTLLPGFVVTTIDTTVPLQIYGGTGELAAQTPMSLQIDEADTPHGRLAQLAGGGYAGVWLGGPLSACQEWYATATPTPCMQRVFTQAYAPSGAPIGSPLELGLSVPYDVSYMPPAFPQVAPLTGGGYVVTWEKSSPQGANEGVWVRRFLADGTPASPAQQVWADGSGFIEVVGLSNGGYAVAGNGKVAAFGANDAPAWQASPAPSLYPMGTQQHSWRGEASLAALPNGGLVIAWNNSGYTSVAQYDATGALMAGGSTTTVDDSTPGTLQHSSAVVLALDDGGYVVGWVEGQAMMARRFNADGSPAGPATQVNVASYLPGSPTFAARLDGGRFMLSWGATESPQGGAVQQWVRVFPADALLAGP